MIELRALDGKKSVIVIQNIVNQYFGYGVQVCHKDSGAPFLDGLAIGQSNHITISHTKSYVAVIISNEPCGIDIESIDRDISRVESRFATAAEKAICRSVFERNPSLLVWCVKEALYKLYDRDGVDFSRDMEIISAQGSTLRARAFSDCIELEWRVIEGENILLVHTKYGT